MTSTSSRHFDIKMPKILVKDGFESIVEVNCRSSLNRRKAVYQIATYFRREFRYDFLQYGEAEDDPTHCAFLWLPMEQMSGWFCHVIGACCFRQRDTGMSLQWIWLHPYYRRQGLLSYQWPRFQEKFGKDFLVEGPVSYAMEQFLRKRDYIEFRHEGMLLPTSKL